MKDLVLPGVVGLGSVGVGIAAVLAARASNLTAQAALDLGRIEREDQRTRARRDWARAVRDYAQAIVIARVVGKQSTEVDPASGNELSRLQAQSLEPTAQMIACWSGMYAIKSDVGRQDGPDWFRLNERIGAVVARWGDDPGATIAELTLDHRIPDLEPADERDAVDLRNYQPSVSVFLDRKSRGRRKPPRRDGAGARGRRRR